MVDAMVVAPLVVEAGLSDPQLAPQRRKDESGFLCHLAARSVGWVLALFQAAAWGVSNTSGSGRGRW